VVQRLDELGREEFRRRKKLADATFLRGGVTFSVYSGDAATERIFPFDLIPRVVAASEWEPVRRGLEQRIQALNLFLADVYGDQRILDEGSVPRALVEGSKGYCKPMRGVRPPGGVYIHIAGIDLIRDASGRVPRARGQRAHAVGRVVRAREPRHDEEGVPDVCCASARSRRSRCIRRCCARRWRRWRRAAATSTARAAHAGPYNSAYFEHGFLARRIGCELVQGNDLFVDGDRVSRRRRTACARSTSCTGASTTHSSIPRCSARTAWSACPGSCAPTRRATSRS
jgi:uncharacterized circularly permuted ATP-grasp superfamily protein